MNKKSWVLGSLLAGVLSVGATAPVAMRVELEPRRQAGQLTEVVVVVQVSPEDRIRIGENAIVRIELDGGTVSSGSPMRAVRLEDDGSTRFTVEWPPGEHHLRVEIEDSRKEDTGLWVGTVRIPDLSPEASVEIITEPAPESESAPVLDSTESETEPDFSAADASDVSEENVVVAVPEEPPVPGPSSEPSPKIEESEAAEVTAEETPEPPVEKVTAIFGTVAVGAAAVPEISEPVAEENPAEIEEPEPVNMAEVAPESPPGDEPEPLQTEEPSEESEEPPLVEPLRADTPSEIAEPEIVAPSQKVEAAPATTPVPADVVAQYEEWGSVNPDVREFSMIVTRGREPAKDVDVSTFQLRVGGSRVPIERLGDAENAPLLLGLAIDVAADEVAGWSGMQGSLSPIVGRAAGGRGRLFVATADGVGAWDAEMDAPGGVTLAQTSDNVAGLVVASIERFRGLRGRTFLVVLTDGRDEPTKEEWQEATVSAGEAGVPILVIALWDDQFNSRVRKNLKKLTEISGGSLFLVQGRAQLESAADRFGRYLDGGYSVRFTLTGDDRQSTTSISVSAADKEIDVSAPKSIR